MILKLANIVFEVKSRYRYTYDMCHDYLYSGDESPAFSIFATNEQIIKEREKSPEFSDDILENTCIYRNICNELLKYNAILIHSAALSVDNRAYLFSANSGTGKTTHMNLWQERFGERAFVINGDKPIIRKISDKFYVFGTPWCGKEGINRNSCVPLKSICIIERAEKNAAVLVDSREAMLFLLTQTIHPSEKELSYLMLDNLGQLIKQIPVYRLGCNMNPEACEVAYKAMSAE